jgi:hypothetical protein
MLSAAEKNFWSRTAAKLEERIAFLETNIQRSEAKLKELGTELLRIAKAKPFEIELQELLLMKYGVAVEVNMALRDELRKILLLLP